MSVGKISPDYVDKEVDPEKLVRIYAEFGLLMEYDEKPENKISNLEERFGYVTNEVLYLEKIGAVEYSDDWSVTLRTSERPIAETLNQRLSWDGEQPEDILKSGALPGYIEEPEIKEDFNTPNDSLDQDPDDELYTRIIEALSGGRALKPGEVEDELAVDVNFDLKPKLDYMETQNAAIRRKDGRYELLPENIDDSFFGEGLNKRGVLAERQRHRNNPWKP